VIVDQWTNDLLVTYRAIRVWWPSGACGVLIVALHEDLIPAHEA
jgi:hypothetical protein